MGDDAARRLARGTAVNWTAWTLARGLALAALLMLARTLDPDELGTLLAALAAGVLGSAIATTGLADATARQAAAGDEAGFGRGDVVRAMRRFVAALPFVLAAVMVITLRSADDIGASGVLAASLLAATQGATAIAASVFRARNQPGRFAIATNLASSAGRAGIALCALVLDVSGDTVLWAFAVLNAAVALATWRHAVSALPDTAAVASGVGALQLGGVLWSLLGNLDVVVVGLLLGAGPAGVYSVSLRVAEFSAQLLVAISLFFMPEATRLAVQGQRAALASLYRVACRWSAFPTLLVAGIGFIAAPELARIVYPDEPDTTMTLLRILLVGYAVQGALGVGYAMLSALGAYRAIWQSSVVGLPLVIVGTVACVELWELTGAACATLAAYAGLSAWWTWRAVVELEVSPFDGRYLRAAAACVAGWTAAGLADLVLVDASPLATFTAVGAAGLAAGAAGLLVFGALSPGERSLLMAGRPRQASDDRPGRARRPTSRS